MHVSVVVVVVVISTLMLLFDIELPNELKGFLFYAQVSRVLVMVLHHVTFCIYRWWD